MKPISTALVLFLCLNSAMAAKPLGSVEDLRALRERAQLELAAQEKLAAQAHDIAKTETAQAGEIAAVANRLILDVARIQQSHLSGSLSEDLFMSKTADVFSKALLSDEFKNIDDDVRSALLFRYLARLLGAASNAAGPSQGAHRTPPDENAVTAESIAPSLRFTEGLTIDSASYLKNLPAHNVRDLLQATLRAGVLVDAEAKAERAFSFKAPWYVRPFSLSSSDAPFGLASHGIGTAATLLFAFGVGHEILPLAVQLMGHGGEAIIAGVTGLMVGMAGSFLGAAFGSSALAKHMEGKLRAKHQTLTAEQARAFMASAAAANTAAVRAVLTETYGEDFGSEVADELFPMADAVDESCPEQLHGPETSQPRQRVPRLRPPR